MRKIALCNIILVDVIKETVKPNQTILIEADTISQIGDADTINVDNSYEIIDGKGKTVIPGLIDAQLTFGYHYRKKHARRTKSKNTQSS